MIRANHQLETMITDLSSFSFSFFSNFYEQQKRKNTIQKTSDMP